MPEVRVLEDAAQELDEAAAHYEHEWPGLGSQFLDAVAEVLDVLGHDFAPTTAISAELSRRSVRRLLMRRFPYAVIVRQRDSGVVEVLAFAHVARRPGYWRERLGT